MLVNFSNHIPHLVVGTLLLPDRESAKIHSNQANPIIRGPNQSLTSPTGMHNSLPLLNPNYSIANVHPIYSGSARGERAFSMHVLLGDVILVQPDAYAQIAFRTA